jgi:hypothetical protein
MNPSYDILSIFGAPALQQPQPSARRLSLLKSSSTCQHPDLMHGLWSLMYVTCNHCDARIGQASHGCCQLIVHPAPKTCQAGTFPLVVQLVCNTLGPESLATSHHCGFSCHCRLKPLKAGHDVYTVITAAVMQRMRRSPRSDSKLKQQNIHLTRVLDCKLLLQSPVRTTPSPGLVNHCGCPPVTH